MGRHKNNAIILTNIKGERGPQGFIGPDGQACYEGQGDPNTLNLALPSYSTDTIDRGSDVLFFQDTVTGDVWTKTTLNGLATSNWVLQSNLNNKGEQGDPGATGLDKVDINLSRDGVMSTYRLNPGENVSTHEVQTFIFPGTNDGPDFSEMKVIAQLGPNTVGVLKMVDQDGNDVGNIQINGDRPTIQTLTNLVFAADIQLFTLSVVLFKLNPTVIIEPEVKLAYISIR
jgi:hypothetical protein